MDAREQAWRAFVAQYQIDVPEHLVENELNYITLEMRHRMQYDALTGGRPHPFAQAELDAQADELRQAAYLEAKSDLVLKEILSRHDISVTRQELEDEALAIARRQNATLDMIRTFFGEDLSMLERDIKERKAIDWALAQAQS